MFDKIKKPFHSWVITLWQFELAVKKRSLIADASCNYQILFYSALLLPSLLFALSMKLDNGRSDKLQVWPRSLPSVSHSICHFHFPFRFNRMSKAADSATLPLSPSLSPSLSQSPSLALLFWGHCEGSSVYLANCEKQFSLSCLDSRLLVIWWSVPKAFDLLCALCLCAAAHHGRRAEWRTHGSAVPALMLPARRAIRPGAVPSRGHAHQHRPRELNVH